MICPELSSYGKRSSFLVASLWCVTACVGASDDDSDSAGDETISQALGTPSIACPAVDIKYNGNVVATTGGNLPPNVLPASSISFGASKMICAVSPTFEPLVENWEWQFDPPREGGRAVDDKVEIMVGGFAQRTFTCPARSFSTAASGWGGIGVASRASAEIRGRRDEPDGRKLLLFRCRYRVDINAAYIHQDRPNARPDDVLVAANRGFYRRSALTSSEIRGGCNNICNQQCTFNLQPGGSGDVIAKCINDCNARCAQ